MTSEEFEKKAAEIESILKGREAVVKWNARIPDPDNPEQLRQIDVLIKEKKKTTIVECRHHKKKQDVKWIEEIYGRKISLEAFSAIAVSSSGFTLGAIKKAEKLGVFLRTLSDVNINEILSWGRTAYFNVNYIQFSDFNIYAVTPEIVTLRDVNLNDGFTTENGEPWSLDLLFSKAAGLAYNTNHKRDNLLAFINIKKPLYISGINIKEIVIYCKFRRLQKRQWLPLVEAYKTPRKNDGYTALKFEDISSKTALYQHSNMVTPIIDLSVVKPVNSAVFRSIALDLGEPTKIEEIRLIGYQEPNYSLFPFKITTIRKNSATYKDMSSKYSTGNLILPY